MAKCTGKGTITEVVKGKKYKIDFCGGKDPETGKYRRVKETFFGTERQTELRIEEIRCELELADELYKLGYGESELASYGLSAKSAVAAGMSIREVVSEVEKRKSEKANRITLGEWTEKYLSDREAMGKRRPATLERERGISKHLVRGLGPVALTDISPAMVSELYATMRKSGVGDTTVKQAHGLLKRILKAAVNNDLILRNPADRVEAPKNPKPKRKSLNIEEANRVAAICTSGEPTANKTAVYIALATGARLGEVLGLQWKHVHMDADRPHILFIQQYTGGNETAPLKTDKDENPVGRVFPIDQTTIGVLKAWRTAQKVQLMELGVEVGLDTPVITNGVGKFTNHNNFERWWREDFCVPNGFGEIVAEDGRQIVELTFGEDASLYEGYMILWRDSEGWPCDETGRRYSRSYKRPKVVKHYDGLRFHSLRHTHFSLRLADGADIQTCTYLGGWSTPTMLLNVYSHPVSENVWASAGFMDKLQAVTSES